MFRNEHEKNYNQLYFLGYNTLNLKEEISKKLHLYI